MLRTGHLLDESADDGAVGPDLGRGQPRDARGGGQLLDPLDGPVLVVEHVPLARPEVFHGVVAGLPEVAGEGLRRVRRVPAVTGREVPERGQVVRLHGALAEDGVMDGLLRPGRRLVGERRLGERGERDPAGERETRDGGDTGENGDDGIPAPILRANCPALDR
ncbi:hypothetical protein [Actinomadura madurae]|uniref:hypothetical protein n=1 Tax=Actinomadura madurae TaxID=1993 RepID=UPI0020D25E13|nr:hypothetical protein [Actinomadura madurae]MCQ0007753.1 hypothetical protein [Actinomadura madurae]